MPRRGGDDGAVGGGILQYFAGRGQSAELDCLRSVPGAGLQLRLFVQRGQPCSPAAWDVRPMGPMLGAGPTIHHARGAISRRDEDVALVAAAARGEAEEVAKLLPRASSPNVHSSGVVVSGAFQGHATTPLHAAAAVGAVDVVKLLLAGGADPSARQSGLRILRPLHEATTPAVAAELLASGASPLAIDPREPDIAWYHRRHGRPEVAEIVAAAAAALRVAVADPSPRGAPDSVGAAPKAYYPCMSSAEIAAALHLWSYSGRKVRAALAGAEAVAAEARRRSAGRQAACTGGGAIGSRESPSPTPMSRAATPSPEEEELECAICLAEICDEDACLLLPCGELGGGRSTAGGAGPADAGGRLPRARTPRTGEAAEAALAAARPHAFHSACLQDWWRKSCRCPTCRRDLRQWLKATGATPPAGAPDGASSAATRRRKQLLLPGGSARGAAVAAADAAGGGSSSARRRFNVMGRGLRFKF